MAHLGVYLHHFFRSPPPICRPSRSSGLLTAPATTPGSLCRFGRFLFSRSIVFFGVVSLALGGGFFFSIGGSAVCRAGGVTVRTRVSGITNHAVSISIGLSSISTSRTSFLLWRTNSRFSLVFHAVGRGLSVRRSRRSCLRSSSRSAALEVGKSIAFLQAAKSIAYGRDVTVSQRLGDLGQIDL